MQVSNEMPRIKKLDQKLHIGVLNMNCIIIILGSISHGLTDHHTWLQLTKVPSGRLRILFRESLWGPWGHTTAGTANSTCVTAGTMYAHNDTELHMCLESTPSEHRSCTNYKL